RFSDLRQIAQVVVRAHELLVAPLFVGANQPHDHLAQFGTPSPIDFLRMHSAVSIQEGNRKVQYKLQLFNPNSTSILPTTILKQSFVDGAQYLLLFLSQGDHTSESKAALGIA